MDKVKQYLELAIKHHFWILCGVAALAGIVAWRMSTNKLTAEFNANADKIKGTFSQLQQIASPHPNETWTAGIQQETAAAQSAVVGAWEKLYREQQENVFVWPKELGDDFLAAAATIEIGKPDVLPRLLRSRYQTWVKIGEVDRLAKIVDAAPAGEAARNPQRLSGMPPGSGGEWNVGEQVSPHRVLWPQLVDIYQWFDWDELPSTQDVQFAQEELWVLEALCKVIAKVNEGSTGAHDASIKAIDELAIAYDAAVDPATATANTVDRVKGPAVGGGGGGGGEPSGPPSGAMMPGGGGPGGGAPGKPDLTKRLKGVSATSGFAPPAADAAAASPDDLWRAGRYVNSEGAPAAAGEDAANEYRLMPFRLALTIDPRSLDRFLLECRRSVLPIEVRYVRINGQERGSGSARASRPPMGMPGYMQMPGSATGEPARRATDSVEINGVIYLIKRPPEQPKPGEAPAGTTPEGEPAPTETTYQPRFERGLGHET